MGDGVKANWMNPVVRIVFNDMRPTPMDRYAYYGYDYGDRRKN